jgi:hypothetical protein
MFVTSGHGVFVPAPAAAPAIHWRKIEDMKAALPLDKLPDDFTLVVDKLFESLATAHNRAEVQRERESQQGFLMG